MSVSARLSVGERMVLVALVALLMLLLLLLNV
jgi:hypothetical protein